MGKNQRLKDVIHYLKKAGVISLQKEFAEKLGINPANVSNAIGGNEKYLSDSFFRRIHLTFPMLSLNWLLTGEGEMLANPDQDGVSSIRLPLVHIDSVGGIHSQNAILEPEYIEKYVPFADAKVNDFCIYQSGDSMYPKIPPGAILHVREVVDWQDYFGYGGLFVLVLDDDRRITKIVDKSAIDATKFVLCKSINPEHADEELPRAKIVRVFKIIHVLINSGW